MSGSAVSLDVPAFDVVLPRRLRSDAPGWTTTADVVVVGSGIAGISVALEARAAGHQVLLVTKARVAAGATQWAQGGIAAVLDEEDSPDDHITDTLVAGAGLCDAAAVRALVNQGPGAVRALIDLGTRFDRNAAGSIALTREGGHLRDRIAHAGGDATGAEIMRALIEAVTTTPGIEVIEHALALDLILDARGAVQGLTLHVMGEGQPGGVGAALAPAVVLAAGGLGQVYAQTTNPAVATGDGVAMALRAGADVADLEFIQFHPTVLWSGSSAQGQQPLISEAVRGEGAFLVDDDGVRFMVPEHPLADLAPRDVTAKAIVRRMRLTGAEHVWLDGRGLGESTWQQRFPTILRRSRERGLDPVVDLIPVAPAQHYASGGVRTDLAGRSSVRGLYVCGESACTGVHGANRLASNSLLEGLVFAERIAHSLAAGLPPRREPVEASGPVGLVAASDRALVQEPMMAGAGVLRSHVSLQATRDQLAAIATDDRRACTEEWENTNLLVVATLIARAADIRTETRGSHWRVDHPRRDDRRWRCRVVQRQETDGSLTTGREDVAG